MNHMLYGFEEEPRDEEQREREESSYLELQYDMIHEE